MITYNITIDEHSSSFSNIDIKSFRSGIEQMNFLFKINANSTEKSNIFCSEITIPNTNIEWNYGLLNSN
jgi:hypothetical protein